MKYYAKISAKNKIETAKKRLLDRGASINELILDIEKSQKNDNSTYIKLKASLIQEKESLTVDTILSLGKNYREIAKEIQWFNANEIMLYIADMDFSYEKTINPSTALEQVFTKLANIEISNVKNGQRNGIAKANKQNYGRPRISYPENWDKDFSSWQAGRITSTEFLQRSGLKKGTFYNLVKEYKRKIVEENKQKIG